MAKKNRRDRVEPSASPAPVVYVVDAPTDSPHPGMRAFPLLHPRENESDWSYVMRIARAVRRAVAAGGTHLLVPREHADWLAENPLLTEYFAARHEVVEANAETGVLFQLSEPRQ